MHQPREKSLTFFLKKKSPKLWAVLQFVKVGVRGARVILSGDTERVDDVLRSFAQAFVEIGQAVNIRPSLVTPRDYFRQAAACNLALKVSLFLPETAAAPEDGRKQIIDLAERAVELQATGLEQLPRSLLKIRWICRLHEREQIARLPLYKANLALLYLGSSEGDPSQTLERALSQLESAFAFAHSHRLPAEVTVKLGASLGSLLLHYPTDALQAYAGRAAEILEATMQALQPRVPVYKKLEELRDTYGPGTSFLKFLFVGLPQGLPLILSMMWRPYWQGVPKEILIELLTPVYPGKIYWALGSAYERLGLYEKAIECLDIAVDVLPSDSNEIAGACLCRGSLSLLRQEDAIRIEDVHFAEEWFDLANDLSEDETIFARGCAELAHVYLRSELLAGISHADKREQFLSKVRNDLRNSLRIVRKHGIHALAQDILSSLATVYTLLGEGERAYRSAALGCRIGDRLHTFARTPRLKTHLASGYASNSTKTVEIIFEHLQAEQNRHDPRKHVLARAAFYFAEQARTRLLQELLANRELLPRGAQHSELVDFFRLRSSWLGAELRLMEMETATLTSLGVTELLRKERNSLETRYLEELSRIREQFNDRAYDPDHPLTPARFSEVSSAIDGLSRARRTALVEYFCTDRRLLVFIVLPPTSAAMSQPIFLDTEISVEELRDIGQHWHKGQSGLRSGETTWTHWANGYLEQTLDNLKPAIEYPRKAIEQWEHESQESIQRVIVVPHRFLHLLPLHAVPLPDGRRWGAAVSIQYVPSASVLCRLRKGGQDTAVASEQLFDRREVTRALVVSHSGEEESLPFNREEALAVAELTGATLIEDEKATPDRVIECMRDASYVHFTCHGAYDSDAPLDSGLQLAPNHSSGNDPNLSAGKSQSQNDLVVTVRHREDGRLTLGRMFEELQLPCSPVVVLSACDTGIPKIEEVRDEYISVPAAFLFAGARAVISTLWQVNDLATWLFMKSVVKELARGADVTDALSRGQQELCRLSTNDVRSSVDRALAREADPLRRRRMAEDADEVLAESDQPFPFASPYWWSGFIVSGVGQAQQP